MVKIIRIILFIGISIKVEKAFTQVIIENNDEIERLLIMKNTGLDTNNIEGYRIQLGFNSDRSYVNKIINKYNQLFPEETQIYSLYQQPYWKFRVGNFYREIDAIETLNNIRVYFPNAFIVPDNIKRPIILKTIEN
ncbi:MAG: hypothetical protein P8I11_06625 [Bacteroidia bacterium]|nr:hypothetical protein [Bacteroidia bacterium]|tara:strand:- start:7940 stop:8347 length:408 start_codon:yes stop_codon:yes gene_type:complete